MPTSKIPHPQLTLVSDPTPLHSSKNLAVLSTPRTSSVTLSQQDVRSTKTLFLSLRNLIPSSSTKLCLFIPRLDFSKSRIGDTRDRRWRRFVGTLGWESGRMRVSAVGSILRSGCFRSVVRRWLCWGMIKLSRGEKGTTIRSRSFWGCFDKINRLENLGISVTANGHRIKYRKVLHPRARYPEDVVFLAIQSSKWCINNL